MTQKAVKYSRQSSSFSELLEERRRSLPPSLDSQRTEPLEEEKKQSNHRRAKHTRSKGHKTKLSPRISKDSISSKRGGNHKGATVHETRGGMLPTRMTKNVSQPSSMIIANSRELQSNRVLRSKHRQMTFRSENKDKELSSMKQPNNSSMAA